MSGEILPVFDAVSIEKAELSSHTGEIIDISNLIAAIGFNESIERVALKGWIRILDTVGLLENTPLLGEEILNLTIRGLDYDTILSKELFIYKIDTVIPLENSAGVSFVAHFMTYSTFLAGTQKVTTSFNKPASSAAEDIFDKTYDALSGQPNNVANCNIFKLSDNRIACFERTDRDIRVVIPTYQPSEALYFLTTKAYSEISASCSFRFFETLDGYFWITDEGLIRKSIEEETVKNVVWSTAATIDPVFIEDQKIKLETFENSARIDTTFDMRSGAYASDIMIVDFVAKTAETSKYRFIRDGNFTGMSGKKNSKKTIRHSKEFVENTFNDNNSKKMLFYRDYDVRGEGQLKGDESIETIVAKKISYDHLIKSTAVSASIKGRIDIRAGNVLNIKIYDMQSIDEREENKQLSGNYLVHTVSQIIEHGKLTTNMALIKNEWKVDVN